MRRRALALDFAAVFAAALVAAPVGAQEPDEAGAGWDLDWGLEAKVHYRDSDDTRFPSPFGFDPPEFLETVDPGSHFEVSVVTLKLAASLGEAIRAEAKVDVIDSYDRNPTSTDREVDVDEVWIRFGREADAAQLPERSGAYLKVGKFPRFERQDDRHLESYGLVSTAFNRFEDAGVEVGADLGRFVYLKASLTQGNPLFMRDPNALAGDNGTPADFDPTRVAELGNGFPILYDAEVEDLDVDGDLETALGLGVRWESLSGETAFDVLAWHTQRDLADTVPLEGTLYGGDLDLLLGPFNAFPLPVTDDGKQETGVNLWLYAGGFSAVAQAVDQEVAGLDRTGLEVELAYQFELPVRWAAAGRQLFPYFQPAVRFSEIDPDFAGGSPQFPGPSLRWAWTKIDYGFRLGIVAGTDLTVEFADNTLETAGGDLSLDELLATLRWRI